MGYTGIKRASASSIEIAFMLQGKQCRERIKLEPTPANLKRAAEHRREILAAIKAGTFDYAKTFPDSTRARGTAIQAPGHGLTLGAWLESWWSREAPLLKASSRTIDDRIRRNVIMPALGDRELATLAWPEIRDWARGLGVGTKTQANYLSILRRALNQAVEDGVLENNPMHGQKIRRMKNRAKDAQPKDDEIDPFSQEEQSLILNALSDSERWIIQFGFSTGLRLSELIALQWADIDLERKKAFISRSLTDYAKGEIEATKTKQGTRTLDLLPGALAAVEKQAEISKDEAGVVFTRPGKLAGWTGPDQLRDDLWTPALHRAGVRYRPPRQMRHTFATRALLIGEPPAWVAAQLGHTNWGFTLRVYYRFLASDVQSGGSKLAALQSKSAG